MGGPVHAHYTLTSTALSQVLLREVGVVRVCAQLRRVLLMGAGDWAQALVDQLALLWRGAHTAALEGRPPPARQQQVQGAPLAVSIPSRVLQMGVDHALQLTAPLGADSDAWRNKDSGAWRNAAAGAGAGGQQGCGGPAGHKQGVTATAAAPAGWRDVFTPTAERARLLAAAAAGAPSSGGSSSVSCKWGVGAGGAADGCVLGMDVPWPACEVVLGGDHDAPAGAAVRAVYADIASALLRLRLCATLLERAWLAVGKPSVFERQQRRAGRGGAGAGGEGADLTPAARERVAHRMQAVRGWVSAASHMVGALQRHMAGALFGRCWAWLEAALAGGGGGSGGGGLDVEQMAAVHAAYLTEAATSCLLPSSAVAGLRPLFERAGWQAPRGLHGSSEGARRALVAAVVACEDLAAAAAQFAEAMTEAERPVVEGGAGVGRVMGVDAVHAGITLKAARWEEAAMAAYGALQATATTCHTPLDAASAAVAGAAGGALAALPSAGGSLSVVCAEVRVGPGVFNVCI